MVVSAQASEMSLCRPHDFEARRTFHHAQFTTTTATVECNACDGVREDPYSVPEW